jgi:hypothetical protein
MQCEQARQLFDAYLDGELSPSLATELGAHRLRCANCRQALALLEVSGHILRSDRDTVQASDDFTDRLLACVDTAPGWRRRVLNTIYIGGPLAAAAVIALAFVGVFDGKRPSQVAGVKELASPAVVRSIESAKATSPAANQPKAVDPAEKALGDFIDQTQQRMKDNGDSVQRVLDLTVLQMLDILEEAKERSQHGPNAGPEWMATPAPPAGRLEREPAQPENPETDASNDVAPEQEQPEPQDP